MQVLEAHPFRVTRDAEMEIQDLDAEDLLDTVERSVRERRFGSVVRLTVDLAMPEDIKKLLAENLGLEPEDIYTFRPLGDERPDAVYGTRPPDLKDPPFMPQFRASCDDQRRRYFRGHSPPRYPAAPSLRLLLSCRRVPASRRPRSRRAGNKADALSCRAKLAGR